ncbi:MAG: hypothetical protein DWQ04_24900 [Chloroflexi bacterium]|nr:MAG: hypothetical protein DWQ04_24900 [Chloroflexota bacterium]
MRGNTIRRNIRTNMVFIGLSITSILIAVIFLMALTNEASSEADAAPASWTAVVEEDFETGFSGSWSLEDLDADTNGEYYWATNTYTYSEGISSAWVAGGGTQGSALAAGTDNYPSNAMSAMTYGPVDLSSYEFARLSYDYWLETEASNDLLQVLISTDNSDYSTVLATYSGSSGWQSNTVDLNAYAGEAQVWIRYYFTSNGSSEDVGAFIDDMLLEATDGELTYLPMLKLDPTPTLTPTPAYFYFDDFSDNTSGWRRKDNRNDKDDCFRLDYIGTLYQMDICDDRTDVKSGPPVFLPNGDYTIEVEARFSKEGGWLSSYGIIFDGEDNPNPDGSDLGNYYMLWIDWEGSKRSRYTILNDKKGSQAPLFDWKDFPPEYNKGDGNKSWNTWRIERTDTQIIIYVNDKHLRTINEPRPYGNRTLFGLFSATYETDDFQAQFDDYLITTPNNQIWYSTTDYEDWGFLESGDFDMEALLPQDN